MDDRTGNAINSMNSIKCSFDPKRSRNFVREKVKHNAMGANKKIFVRKRKRRENV